MHFASPFQCFSSPTPLTAVLLLLATAVRADILAGRVADIADADTLTMLDASKTQQKVGLSGIDSPEKGQPFAALQTVTF